jgi:hypothetical protein
MFQLVLLSAATMPGIVSRRNIAALFGMIPATRIRRRAARSFTGRNLKLILSCVV